MKKEKLFNVPNSLTFLRLVAVPVFFLMLVYEQSMVALGIVFLVAAITDVLDGQIARRFNQVTRFGARFDQVVDRIFMVSIVLMLYFYIFSGEVILLAMVMSREIVGIPGLLVRKIRGKGLSDVRIIGKVTMVLQCAAIAAFIFGFSFAFYLILLTFVVGIFSGSDYFIRSFR